MQNITNDLQCHDSHVLKLWEAELLRIVLLTVYTFTVYSLPGARLLRVALFSVRSLHIYRGSRSTILIRILDSKGIGLSQCMVREFDVCKGLRRLDTRSGTRRTHRNVYNLHAEHNRTTGGENTCRKKNYMYNKNMCHSIIK